MTSVFDHSQSRLADRLVLLVIADRSQDDGTGCFRGKESIAHMAGISRSQVTVTIRRLQELGELEVTERPGRSNEYRITLSRPGQILAAPPIGLADTRLHVCPTPGYTGSRDSSSYSSSESSAEKAAQEEPWRPTGDELKAGRSRAPDALKVARSKLGL